MAYFDVSATMADHNLYPTMYTVNLIFHVFNPLLIQMMKYFGWTRIGTISDAGDMYESVSIYNI